MEILFGCCGALDIHLKSIQAHVRRRNANGVVSSFAQRFGTTTAQILALGDWLAEHQVEKVAMEATGVYWKPIWNLLEDRFSLMLVNAQHFHNVPGRKTDVNDAAWLAQLLQCGLLRDSFVPPRPQRELRDLARQRTALVEDKSRVVNRIQKTLEDANIKLSSVASDVVGVSGRAMIRAMIAGQQDPAALADLARQRLRTKIPELREALRGGVRAHHRFMLKQLMDQLQMLEGQIEAFEARLDELLSNNREPIERLREIPGIDTTAARLILSEIGTDMSRFPSAAHLCAWAGVCPGNNESAGKCKSGRTRDGNRWLRRVLVQVAWAASQKKDSYFYAQHRRIAFRRGMKRATMAVARSILTTLYHMLKTGSDFIDLGVQFFDKLKPMRAVNSLVRRLEAIGYQVQLRPKVA
ncbi:Transposase IS116/IS110/IS902 family protein [Phycisphaerae bacterium RAS1]|nr:Transposase IS116/IS110/IS902 family protein [Phycisphaerae bacterium RAS1]TWT42019.1 Transposase IS116/IS110/IS902 family protein [Phycisphaerae bacterium RAS1]TWT45517.1 Transposase IS116/IS110/IS902 family protein [Phycisphaerae bacterium RAS1]